MWKQGWVFPLFSPDSDDRLSLNFHRFVILYRSCDTQSVGLGQYCLPKVSNGFKKSEGRNDVLIGSIEPFVSVGFSLECSNYQAVILPWRNVWHNVTDGPAEHSSCPLDLGRLPTGTFLLT